MEVNIEEIGPCKKKISIKIPAEEIKTKHSDKLAEFAKSFQMPGFRVGHVPRRLIEKKFGEQILEELKATLIQESYQQVLEDHNLLPLTPPDIPEDQIQFSKDSPLIFELTIEVKPEFELGEYKGLEVEVPKITVKDKDIDAALNELRQQQAELVPIEGQADDNDMLVCDVNVRIDGENVWGCENLECWVNQTKLPQKEFPLPKDLLKNVAVGEVRHCKVKLSDTFHDEEYRGKETEIFITVKDIKRIELPELDEEFFKTLNCNTLEEVREGIRQQLLQNAKIMHTKVVEDAVINKLIAQTEIDLPAGIIENQTTNLLNQRKKLLREQGVSEEEIEKQVQQMRDELRTQVIRGAKESLILEKVAKAEKIFVLEREVDERINAIAASQNKWPNEIRQYYENNDLMDDLRSRLRDEKARKALCKYAVVKEVEA